MNVTTFGLREIYFIQISPLMCNIVFTQVPLLSVTSNSELQKISFDFMKKYAIKIVIFC